MMQSCYCVAALQPGLEFPGGSLVESCPRQPHGLVRISALYSLLHVVGQSSFAELVLPFCCKHKLPADSPAFTSPLMECWY